MQYEIKRCSDIDETDILETLKRDSEWSVITSHKTIDKYKDALKNGITYVARRDSDFCGFIRAIKDEEVALYVSELYVKSACRNLGIGQALIERIKQDFENFKIYALSDEDRYYKKKGYKKIGSVFEI